ncbi:MAG TPA: potassium transporter TrkG [Candidatus Saccharimonadia bacterium]|nr:potassium transporter TrkG [Candidatus Saccharimonadia bacterium]
MRVFIVQRIIGVIVALSGAMMLPPLALSLALDDGAATAFAESLLVCLVAGGALWLPVRGARGDMRLRDGFLVTALAWVTVSLFCALPLMWAPPQLGFADAFFESASGLTTTGATVISGLDALPKSVLLFRQTLHFYGGLGIIVLAIAVLPMLRVGGAQLFRTESAGSVKDTKLTPRIAETARALWLIFVGLNVACAIAFWIGGMNVFDAITHAFSAVATGGFGNYDASFAQFDSHLLESIAIVFMFLGGVNFALHFNAWRRATLGGYFGDSELKAYFAIALVASFVVTFELYARGAYGFGESLRHSSFHVVSSLTTTGFTTTGFAGWSGFAPVLMILLGTIGGCAGSTAGGIKVVRIVVLLRQGAREMIQLVHPRGRFHVKLGQLSVPGQALAAVTGFCTLYAVSFLVLTLALAATGLDFLTAWSAIGATLSNLGPGLGRVGVHFGDLSDVAVWICSFAMILGRLEIFTLLVLFMPAFWKE